MYLDLKGCGSSALARLREQGEGKQALRITIGLFETDGNISGFVRESAE
jgi:hypothetical protein